MKKSRPSSSNGIGSVTQASRPFSLQNLFQRSSSASLPGPGQHQTQPLHSPRSPAGETKNAASQRVSSSPPRLPHPRQNITKAPSAVERANEIINEFSLPPRGPPTPSSGADHLRGLFKHSHPPVNVGGGPALGRPHTARDWHEEGKGRREALDGGIQSNSGIETKDSYQEATSSRFRPAHDAGLNSGERRARSARPPTAPSSFGSGNVGVGRSVLSFSLNEAAGVGSKGTGGSAGGYRPGLGMAMHHPLGIRGVGHSLSPRNTTGSLGRNTTGERFHKGVVNALGSVLRDQRSSLGLMGGNVIHPTISTWGSSIGDQEHPLRKESKPIPEKDVENPSKGDRSVSYSAKEAHALSVYHDQLEGLGTPQRLHTNSEECLRPSPPREPKLSQRTNINNNSRCDDRDLDDVHVAEQEVSAPHHTHTHVEDGSSERERKEIMVAQRRAEWAQQRWSASARGRRRAMEKEVSVSLSATESTTSGAQCEDSGNAHCPSYHSASSLLSSSTSSVRGNHTKEVFSFKRVDDNVSVHPRAGHNFIRSACFSEVEYEESFSRKTLVGSEAEGFVVLQRLVTIVMSRPNYGVSLFARRNPCEGVTKATLTGTCDGDEEEEVSLQSSSLPLDDSLAFAVNGGQSDAPLRPPSGDSFFTPSSSSGGSRASEPPPRRETPPLQMSSLHVVNTSAQLRKEQLAALTAAREEGNAHYRARNYAAAHAIYSRIADAAGSAAGRSFASPTPSFLSSSGGLHSSNNSSHTSLSRDAFRELHARVLLNRCATGLALLNYDGCVADGLEVVRIVGTLASDETSSLLHSSSQSEPNTDAPSSVGFLRVKAWLRVAKAYVMVESYKAALDAYRRAQEACVAVSPNTNETKAMKGLKETATREMLSIPAVQKVREAFAARQFSQTLDLANETQTAETSSNPTKSDAIGRYAAVDDFARDAPIALLLLEAETNTRPLRARVEGSKYVSALLEVAEKCELKLPSTATTTTLADPSELTLSQQKGGTSVSFSASSLILANFTQHICDALVCVGRAAFYSGPLYAKVAAQRVGMCTSLRHDHKGALTLREEIGAYERLSSAAAASVEKGKPAAAIEQLTRLLEMARQLGSGPLIASAALARADVFSMKLNNTPSAISDTNIAIEAEPLNPRTHAARSRLFQGIGDYKRALKDMSTAAALYDDQHAERKGTASSHSTNDFPLVNPYQDDADELARQCREESDPMGGFGFAFGGFGFDFGRGKESPRPSTSPWASSSSSSSFRNQHGGDGGGSGGGRGKRGNTARGARTLASSLASARSPYTILGIASTSSVSEVRQAYRRLVLTCHPDKFVSASDGVREEKERLFKEISKAYADITERHNSSKSTRSRPEGE